MNVAKEPLTFLNPSQPCLFFFKTSAEVLMAEAGMQLIHPTAFNFKKLVLNGEWSQAVKSKCKFFSNTYF